MKLASRVKGAIIRFFDGALVPLDPVFTPRSLLGRPASLLPFPFRHHRAAYTFNGSAALAQASDVLGLAAPDTVLCPAYNCGHEIQPFLSRGLEVRLFAVGAGLKIDVEDLRSKIDATTKAVLVTHYFGFPQPLDEIRVLCDEHNLWLIEDCAHALWSSDEAAALGTVGDVAVFSMRKSLPLLSGGALVVNNDRLRSNPHLSSPPVTVTGNKVLERWLTAARTRHAQGSWFASLTLVALMPMVAARMAVQRLPLWGNTAWYDTDDPDFDTDEAIYGWGMDTLSRRIAERIDADRVRARRRENYEWLIAALPLEIVTPIFTELPDHVCPWVCPVLPEDPDGLSAKLDDRGIDADIVWLIEHDAVDWDQHPRELDLKRRVLALPIHQDIDRPQLQLIVDVMSGQH